MSHNSGLQGGISGASAGFAVAGPVGAWVGFVAGAFGGKSKRRRARREEARILSENTKQAYGIGATTYEGIRQSRDDIQKTYTSNLQTDIAGFAASGRVLTDDQRNRMIGSNAGERDTALEGVSIQEGKYKNSASYRAIQDDYNFMKAEGIAETNSTLSIPSEGRSGEGFYTDKQKKMLMTIEFDDEMDDIYKIRTRFERYANNLAPTFEEYEKSLYGTDEEKAAFESDTTNRIKSANANLKSGLMFDKLEEERRYNDSMDD